MFFTRKRARLMVCGLLCYLPAAFAAQDPQAILSASDAIRNPTQSFSLTTQLLDYQNGKQKDATTVIVYSRPDPRSGQYRSLLRFTAPERDAGKLMLKQDQDIWFYEPTSKASVRISPQQRLLGQAANGDVVSTNFAADYKATAQAEEVIEDGHRKQQASIRLTLKASTPQAVYHHIELWVKKEGWDPIKAQFYSESERLLKTAWYRRYQQQLGASRPTEIVIMDGLDPQLVTIMRNQDYHFRDIPERWFQRDYLVNFRADATP